MKDPHIYCSIAAAAAAEASLPRTSSILSTKSSRSSAISCCCFISDPREEKQRLNLRSSCLLILDRRFWMLYNKQMQGK